MVLRPDITAQNLAVGEAAAGMFIVNAYNVLYSERVAASYNPVPTLFHTSEIIIPSITSKPDTKIRITAYIHNKGRHINHTAAFRGFIGVSSTSWTAWSYPTISEKHPNNPKAEIVPAHLQIPYRQIGYEYGEPQGDEQPTKHQSCSVHYTSVLKPIPIACNLFKACFS